MHGDRTSRSSSLLLFADDAAASRLETMPEGSPKEPCYGCNYEQQYKPAYRACKRGRVPRRPRILREPLAALEHPVPRGVRDERRDDDRAETLGDDVPEEQVEHGNEQQEHEQLPELDADVEREKRGDEVRARELERLPEREGEAEPVHETERERDDPPARELVADDVLERHVEDGRRDQ